MTNVEKNLSQAQAIVPIANFRGRPLAGPGRWAQVAHGLTFYTNDADVLFVRGQVSSVAASILIQEINQAFKAGETASEAFDRLRQGAPVVSGDLSDFA